MSTGRTLAGHLLASLGLGTIFVATPVPINLAAFVIWAVLGIGWVKRQARANGRRAGAAELVIQLATMSVLVAAAGSASCKVVDRVKARNLTLPKQVMTIAELQEPEAHQLVRPSYPYWVSAGDNLAGRVVRFPSRDLTVGEFIAAIEAQTPLRHRFQHCGNGTTILWCGDCSFGVWFRATPR